MVGKNINTLENKVDYESHEKYNSILPDFTIDDWKKYQCPECREGDRSKCSATKKNARCYRVDHEGKTHYYCFIGCMMLELQERGGNEAIEKASVSQWNEDGHYEKLANS